MVSDNMSDPGPSNPPPTVSVDEALRQMFQELTSLRAANEILHGRMQELMAQASQQQADQRATQASQSGPTLSGLKPKPTTFEGKENLLEGWLSSTRDILKECYNLAEEGKDMIRAARIYLQGPARTSWDALVRSSGDETGGLANWQAFATWLRATHGSAAPQVVQGTLLMRLKQKGSLQNYINKWNEHAAQLPITLSDEVAQLWFVENLDDEYHQLANQYRVAHPQCNLQDIMQYLRMVNVDGRNRGIRQAQQVAKSTATPMEVDLAAMRAQLASLERKVNGEGEDAAYVNRLTAEQIQEHRDKNLCFNCSQPGHISMRCPKLKGKNKRWGNQQRKR